MSLSAKRESLVRIHGRYQRAGRPHKTRILDEFCATCGYHRKAALRLLNRPLETELERAFQNEIEAIMRCFSTVDAHEATVAFRAKRPPVFQGK